MLKIKKTNLSIFCLLTVTGLSLYSFDIPQGKTTELDKKFGMQALTVEMREAGFGIHRAGYWSDYPRAMPIDADALHTKGHVIDKRFLEDMFLVLLFPFYTERGFGVYAPSFGLGYKNKKFKEKIDNAIRAFMKNKDLLQLGAAYQRQKVIVEKLEKLIDKVSEEEKEAVLGLLLRHDKLAEDLQIMIYNWMMQGYGAFSKGITKTEPLENLETYKPDFVTGYPYYATIMQNLDEYVKPVPAITVKDTISL